MGRRRPTCRAPVGCDKSLTVSLHFDPQDRICQPSQASTRLLLWQQPRDQTRNGFIMITSIGFGTAQVQPETGRVELAPGERLTVGLGVSATTADELEAATAFVWTNCGANDPSDFQAVQMTSAVPGDSHQRAFVLTLAEAKLGTFIVSAYVELGGVRYWADDYVAPDNRPSSAAALAERKLRNRLVFRVRDPALQRLLVCQVPIDKANARADATDISTIDDMLSASDSRWYTLQRLKDQGVNCVWVQVPYRIDLWDRLPAVDDAGSDYASTDWFSIDPELSKDARYVASWDHDLQRDIANTKLKELVDEAHDLGFKVLFEIAPHHVGHNYIFRDVFGDTDVRRRDYTQVAVDATQLQQVMQRLSSGDYDEFVKDYMEWMLPQMYAARYGDGTYNPFGASSVYETYSPYWYGDWSDVKHLNHGGHALFEIWVPRTQQNYKVLAYIGRAMSWAVNELGADGFRIDHTFGMPFHFFEQTLPWVEMKLREKRGNAASLILVHEDHDRKNYTARVGDVIQSNSYMDLLRAFASRNLEAVWAYYQNPWLAAEFVGTGNHDERRGSTFFNGDLIRYGNTVMMMALMGGAMTMLAGDEYAEAQQLRFKAKGGIPTLWQLNQAILPGENANLAAWIARAAHLRNDEPALAGSSRQRLGWLKASNEPIFACARYGAADGPPLIVVDNLGQQWSTGQLDIGSQVRNWISSAPAAFYQIKDLLGLDPARPLWSRPIYGQTIIDEGLSIGLQSCQIQVLQLQRLP
jgi:glycosidase